MQAPHYDGYPWESAEDQRSYHHPAGIQDRDGAPDLLKAVGKKFPSLRFVFADGGYGGDKLKEEMGDEWTLDRNSQATKQGKRLRFTTQAMGR